MKQTDERIQRLLMLQGGVVARREHPELVGRLDWMARRGRLKTVLPGIYVEPDLCYDPFARIRAAMRWMPDGILTGRAAAKMTFWDTIRVDTITMAINSGRRGRPGFELTRRRVPREQIRQRLRLRYTSPALTALDLVPDVGGDAIDRVLRTGAATLDDLRAAMEQISGRRGNADRIRMLLDSRNKPWSASERLIHRLLRGARITGWDTNWRVDLPEGTFFLDVAFPELMLALEIDGWEFHGKFKGDFERTWRRHNALVAAGWCVLHITWQQLTEEPQWVLAKIREVMENQKSRMSMA